MAPSPNQMQHTQMQKTMSAFIWTRVLGVPFWGLVNMLSIILYKDLHISAFQVTAIVALKPMSALLAPYWSQVIYQRPDRIASNLVWSNILKYFPFLFLYWIDSAWVIIIIFGLHMTLYRGAIPAWMETFKRHLPEVTQERFVAYGTIIDYCGTALLPLALGTLLDEYAHSWRWLFPCTALLGMASTWFLYRIPEIALPPAYPTQNGEEASLKANIFELFKEQILKPWKQSWQLIKTRADFAHFQIGFMLGGAGLIIIQPALPIFFVDTLHLSYTKMLVALAVCKGIGLAITSRIWTRLFRKIDIHYLSGLVALLAALFPFLLIGAQQHISFLYLAYGLYGVMQAGSELNWNMSGPVFSKDQDSSIFSGINVLTVGVRGSIVPFIGTFLFTLTNSTTVMLAGSFLSILAASHLIRYSRKAQVSRIS